MSDVKHTEGPWLIEETYEDGCQIVSGAEPSLIASMVIDGAEDKANAHLIAAAPVGFELAEEFMAFAQSGAAFTYPPGSLQKLERYISRARGEAQ